MANNNLKQFAIVGGYMIEWSPNNISIIDWLLNKRLTNRENLNKIVCGHVDNEKIYFYSGDNQVTDRVKEVALKWYNLIGNGKELHFGENKIAI